MSFVHLHVHTEFSLLDGACRIRDLPGIVKAMGQTACAVTDHGVMYGAVDFYRACKAEGVKPIIGCEVYVTPQGRTRFDKVHELDAESRHLVLLCENEEGYRNLSYLVSMGWTEGFYIKPRIDLELLRQYSGGLIALSACLAGEIPRRLRNGEYENAKAYALELSHIFGPDRFYLELQDHGIRDQAIVNQGILRIHRETGLLVEVLSGDEEAELERAVLAAAEGYGLVLVSGGSSAGERDAVARVIGKNGRLLFHGLAMRPGKPAMLGEVHSVPVLGLPGHPAAAYLTAKLLAGALLRSLLGQPAEPRPVPARLTEPLPANDGRELHCGVRLSREGGELYAEPVRTKSGLISALAASDGVLRVPRDCEGLPRGALVEVELEEF